VEGGKLVASRAWLADCNGQVKTQVNSTGCITVAMTKANRSTSIGPSRYTVAGLRPTRPPGDSLVGPSAEGLTWSMAIQPIVGVPRFGRGQPMPVVLWELADAWADAAGQPRIMVLGNLCDWVMAGAFPDGSVLTFKGEPVDASTIYLAGRAAAASDGSVHMEGFFTVTLSEADKQMLREIVISESGLRAFCHATSTQLPSFLRRKPIWPWKRVAAAGNVAPPPCAGVEARAALVIGLQRAESLLQELRRQLKDARGRRTGSEATFDEAALGYSRRRWDSSKQLLLGILSKLGDAKRSDELARLDAELEEILAVVEPKAGPAKEEPPRPKPASADISSPSRRRVSTKQYAQEKLNNWYKQRIAEFMAKGVTSTLEQDWAAAKAGGFDSISRDCIREVRQLLAPAKWKQRGRPPSRN
jgi:hypothetical protein